MSVQHYVKSVRILIFSDRYFPVVGLNTEIYSVNLRFPQNTGQKNFKYRPFLCRVMGKFLIKMLFLNPFTSGSFLLKKH